MAVTYKIIEILKNLFKGIFLNVYSLEIWRINFRFFQSCRLEYPLKESFLSHGIPLCNFIQNWSTDGPHCVSVFPSFARLLPGRHVYGLCTALTKFHRESHSSSSSLLSPFSTSPFLAKSRGTFPAGRRTYVSPFKMAESELTFRFSRCS